jgi:hypothetical protein
MVSLSNGQAPDDQLLVRYLVGSLADDEAERLDELSVADDQFASHLSAVEHDLVDAYVKGELSGDTLSRFRSRYLSAPANREKVRFAETFLRYQRRAAPAPAHAATGRHWFPSRRRFPQWGLAAVALLALAVPGYLIVENLRLRNQMSDERGARAGLEERAQQLQRQLNEQRSASVETAIELARVRESLAQLEARSASTQQGGKTFMPSFMLRAATRGAGDIATIAIPAGTDAVTLQLDLEEDFPRYRIALKDPATDQIVWRGDNLQATSTGEVKSLPITLSASLLKPQTYTVELTGVPARGAAELVSSYTFRVVIK